MNDPERTIQTPGHVRGEPFGIAYTINIGEDEFYPEDYEEFYPTEAAARERVAQLEAKRVRTGQDICYIQLCRVQWVMREDPPGMTSW
jgi:hypothetical protein